MFFVSVSEDGLVCIWDSRAFDKDSKINIQDFIWKPMMQINLFRQDGSGELGLAKVMFHPK